jgi:hypothetical protein
MQMIKNMISETLIQTVFRMNVLKKDKRARFHAGLLQAEGGGVRK